MNRRFVSWEEEEKKRLETNIIIQFAFFFFRHTIGWELPSCGICLYLGLKVNLNKVAGGLEQHSLSFFDSHLPDRSKKFLICLFRFISFFFFWETLGQWKNKTCRNILGHTEYFDESLKTNGFFFWADINKTCFLFLFFWTYVTHRTNSDPARERIRTSLSIWTCWPRYLFKIK